jgi:hypothetical protein
LVLVLMGVLVLVALVLGRVGVVQPMELVLRGAAVVVGIAPSC